VNYKLRYKGDIKMYFDNIDIFNVEDNIDNLENIYAHRDSDKSDREKEKLTKHIELTYEYFIFIFKQKNLENVFINFEKKFFKDKEKELIDFWKEMIINCVYMHDLGKINPGFQWDVMENDIYEDYDSSDSKHSMLGAYIYISYFNEKIFNFKLSYIDKKFLRYFMYVNSYLIAKHHGYLGDFEGYSEDLTGKKFEEEKEDEFPDLKIKTIDSCDCSKFLDDIFSDLSDELLKKNDKFNFNIYIYSKLLFSLLTASDYYATSEFMDGQKITDIGVITEYLKKQFKNTFDNYKITKAIRDYEKKPVLDGNYKNINQLRNEITLESEKNYLNNKEKNIFYLEAPTGAGKTITSVNLANLMMNSDSKINKLFYIFPFNTLVEQTEKGLMDIFKNSEEIKKNISVINSLTPIKTVDENEDYKNFKSDEDNKKIDYKRSLLNRIFLHYPFIITTHVNMFNYLFGTSREENFPLIDICNSVIIIDEIQSYKNGIWKEIINFFNSYAEILNIKLIIMSATLPRLNKLVEGENDKFVYLINNRKHYFENHFFKDRVKFEILDLSKIDKNNKYENAFKILSDDIEMESKFNDKILIEFIFKKSADRFFDYIKDIDNFKNVNGHEIKIITSDDNKIDRREIINLAKEINRKVIIVATQVIEAGVDIDMNLGYKNISILDAEEQFMGRINRSCINTNTGRVKFFKLDSCGLLYQNDARKEKRFTLENVNIQEILRKKDFESYYKNIISEIEIRKKRNNDNGYSSFIKELNRLNFNKIKDYMKLIDEKVDQNKYTIFLSREIKDLDGNIIYGNEVWEEYKNLLMNNKIDYSEKRVKLSKMNAKLSYFVYKVKRVEQYNELLGNIYYIDNGKDYIVNGRFNNEKFIGETPDQANLIL
jgi:CRISPR-associated endonuclease/helicase Cas3